MPEEIFDQERPPSRKARRLDEALAGGEEWTLAPPAARRGELDVAPWLGPDRGVDPGAYGDPPESRAA
jgi:hypothetical protein